MKSDKRVLLISLFVAALVLSNVLSIKIISIGWLSVPGGVVCYAVTFLISDVLGEIYGKEASKTALRCGLYAQLLCTALIILTVILPGLETESNSAFGKVFAFSAYSTAASLIAYLVSQSLDVAIFHSIKQKLIGKGKAYKWIWNNISTIISQTADAVIYIGLAFGVGQGFDIGTLGLMVASQIIVKWILAVLDTPLFYLLTRKGAE